WHLSRFLTCLHLRRYRRVLLPTLTPALTPGILQQVGRLVPTETGPNTVTPGQGEVTVSEHHPTARPQTVKPAKPYPDFPLFPHATKRWAKKIRGQLHYFGPWDDPDGALAKYLEQKDDLHAGRKPREQEVSAGVTVKVLCNAFLNHKEDGLKAGDLSPRT